MAGEVLHLCQVWSFYCDRKFQDWYRKVQLIRMLCGLEEIIWMLVALVLLQQESNRSYSIAFVLSKGSLCNLLVQLHIQIYLRTGFLEQLNIICQSKFRMGTSSSLAIISTSVGLILTAANSFSLMKSKSMEFMLKLLHALSGRKNISIYRPMEKIN